MKIIKKNLAAYDGPIARADGVRPYNNYLWFTESWSALDDLSNRYNSRWIIGIIDEFKNEMLTQLEKMEKHASSTEEKIDILYNLARLVSRADNLFSTTWANRVRKLLLKLRNLDEIRYQTEVMDK